MMRNPALRAVVLLVATMFVTTAGFAQKYGGILKRGNEDWLDK